MEQTNQKLGTDKLKTIVLAVVALGIATSKALEDGFQASKDITTLMPPIFALPPLLSKENIQTAKEQFADFDPQERKQMIVDVENEIDLANDITEEKIEAGFNLVMAVDRARVAFMPKKV